MTEDFLWRFIPSSIIAMLAIISRIVYSNWFAPGPFFALCWTIYVFLPLIILPQLPVYPKGLWMIALMIFSFETGAFVLLPTIKIKGNARISLDNKIFLNRLHFTILLFTFIAVIGIIILTLIGINTFALDFSIESFLKLGRGFSILRYFEKYEMPWEIRIFLYWMFPAALCGGFYFAFSKTLKQKIVSLLPILVSVLNGIIVAARAGIFFSISIWVAGFLASKGYESKGKLRIPEFRLIFIPLVGAILLFVIYFLLQLVRGGIERIDYTDIVNLVYKVKIDIWGYLSAFTIWFEDFDTYPTTLGAYTFAGLFDLIGLTRREQGLYIDPVYFESGGTNIYTMFRGVIQDFTIPGALIIFFILGFISSWVYRKCCNGHPEFILPLSLFYSTSIYSFIVSPFVYNSYIFSWLIVSILWFFYLKARR
jgi:oligosaccharide repeat unit polymerase